MAIHVSVLHSSLAGGAEGGGDAVAIPPTPSTAEVGREGYLSLPPIFLDRAFGLGLLLVAGRLSLAP